MKARIVIIWLMLILLLQGCERNPILIEPTQNQTVMQSPSVVSTASGVLVVPITTPTVLPTATDIATNTITVTEKPIKTCLTMLPSLPTVIAYPGKIIFTGILNLDDPKHLYRNVFLYDLQTQPTISALPVKVMSIGVSPDRLKYAVDDAIDGKVKIFSSNGQLLTTLPQGKYPYSIDQWLDNQHLALVVQQPLEGTDYYKYPRDEVVIDTYTNAQKLFPSSYPNIDMAQARMIWDGISTTKYDPQLSRVIYAAVIENDYLGKRGAGYVLWDLVKHVKLVQIVTRDFYATPKWAPDGSKFIFNDAFGNGEFYIVTRDGAVTQISHLNKGEGQSAGENNFSDRYSWSPDGRYLAFWREFYQQERLQGTFAILDTKTGEVTDYCISTGYTETGSPRLLSIFTPIWSPDGKVVATIANRQEGGNFVVVLLDLQGKVAVKVEKNIIPVGWLSKVKN